MHANSVFCEKPWNIFSWVAKIIFFFTFLSQEDLGNRIFCFLDDHIHYWKQQQVRGIKTKQNPPT